MADVTPTLAGQQYFIEKALLNLAVSAVAGSLRDSPNFSPEAELKCKQFLFEASELLCEKYEIMPLKAAEIVSEVFAVYRRVTQGEDKRE